MAPIPLSSHTPAEPALAPITPTTGTNGRRPAPTSRLAGLTQVFASSRNLAFLVAIIGTGWAWGVMDRSVGLVLPFSLEALLAAIAFVPIFLFASVAGGFGALLGWFFGRRFGRPREGASGGALGFWLAVLIAVLLGRLAGALKPVGAITVLLSPWIGARWLGPMTGAIHRGWDRLPAQFNQWAVRHLVRRHPRIDLRGPFLGALAGLLAGLVALTSLGRYPEALFLAARIRLRNQPINTAVGTIEWQQALRRPQPGPRRPPPSMAILEMDNEAVAQALARSSEADLQVEMLRRLRRSGARRIVLPVMRALPQELKHESHSPGEAGSFSHIFRGLFYWRRPPLPSAALARLRAGVPRLAAELRATPEAIVCPIPTPPTFNWYQQAREAPEIADPLLRSARQVGSAEFSAYHVEQLPTLRSRDSAGRVAVPLLLALRQADTGDRGRRGDGSWPPELPTVRPGQILLNVGASGSGALVPHVSYSTLLSGHRIYDPQSGQWVPPERFFRNRVAFLDTLYQPQYETPVGRLTAMELLAAALDNLVRSGSLAPLSTAGQLLMTLLFGALVGRLSLGSGPAQGFARLVGVFLTYLLLAFGSFLYPGLWLPIFPMWFAGLLSFLLSNQFVFAVDAEELSRQRAQQAQHERERALSREIQTSLLPPPVTCAGEFTLVSRSEPAREVGGDFCSIFSLTDKQRLMGVALGDVAGKGIRGAMYMTVATTLLEACANSETPPRAVLADANARLYPKIHRLRMFVTAVYATLDTVTGEVTYASAGQVPPLHLTADANVSYLPAVGAPLGSLVQSRYRDERIRLHPGEALLLISDGFVEARNPQGQPLGYEGFRKLVGQQLPRQPEALLDALFESIHAYMADASHDDLTLLLIRREVSAEAQASIGRADQA